MITKHKFGHTYWLNSPSRDVLLCYENWIGGVVFPVVVADALQQLMQQQALQQQAAQQAALQSLLVVGDASLPLYVPS